MNTKLIIACLAAAILETTVPCRANTTNPVIFNSTESVKPGQVIGLQGENFGTDPQVWIQVVTTSSTPTPTTQLTNIISKSNQFVAAEIPTSTAMGLYAVFVKNTTTGVFSAYKWVNQPRVDGWLDTADSSVHSSQAFRIYGRNLKYSATTTTVKFRLTVSPFTVLTASVPAQTADPFILSVVAPAGIVSGQIYDVIVNNGYGSTNGDSPLGAGGAPPQISGRSAGVSPDYWSLGVSWAGDFPFSTKIFNVKTDFGAAGNGTTNDSAAIQNAINAASAFIDSGTGVQGGVVYFPAGTYNVDGAHILMKPRVILQGAGKTLTKLSDNAGLLTNAVFYGTANNVGVVDLALECGVNGNSQCWDVGGSGVLFHFFLRSRFVNNRGKTLNHFASLALIDSCELVHRDPDADTVLDFTSRQRFIIRNSTIQWVHGRIPLLSTLYMQLENNTWYRGVERVVGGVQYGGPSMGGANYVAIINNTFQRDPKLLDGSATPATSKIPENNDGETLLNEDAQYLATGHVASTTDTVMTSTNSWSSDQTGRYVTIVNGQGMGQTRKIIASTTTAPYTLTLETPWDVNPGTGASYAINKFDRNYLCKGNLLQDAPRGIWLTYAGPIWNMSIVNNTLTDGQAIYLRGQTEGGRFNVQNNVLVEGNILANTKNWYRSAIVVDQVRNSGLVEGNPFYNVVVRDNSITVPSSGGLSGADVGTGEGEGYFAQQKGLLDDAAKGVFGVIFDHNAAINLPVAYNVNTGSYQTVIFNSINTNVRQVVNDTLMTGGSHMSVGTVTSWTTAAVTPPYVSVSAVVNTAAEGPYQAKFRFTRSGTSGNLVVNYTKGGSATATDYTPTLTGSVTIPSGASSVDVVVTPVLDGLIEGDETLTLTLAASANYNIGNPNATVTFTDPNMPFGTTWIGTSTPSVSLGAVGGVFTLTAGGTSIGGTADDFGFAYTTLTGDGSISAKLSDWSGGNSAWRIGGVMIRESTASGSKFAMTGFLGSQGARFIQRTTTGGAGSSTTVTGSVPYWVRITRTGSTLTSETSSNGTSWVNVGTTTISMASQVLIGLALEGNSGVAVANFADLKLTGTISSAAAVIMDNTDATGVVKTGTWTSSTATSGYYGSDYIHDGNTGKGTKSVRYTPNLTQTRSYQVYVRWTADSNRDSNVPIDITSASGVDHVLVNEKQDNGVWVLLGTYSFNLGTGGNLLILNTGTTGYVVADAVSFVPR